MIGRGNHQQQFCLGSRWSCLTGPIKMFQPHVIETGPNCRENYGTLIRGVPIYEADFLFATSSEFLNFKMYFYKKSEFSTSMISGATTHMTREGPDFDSSPPRSKWCTMGNGSFKLSSNSFGLQVLKVRVKTLIQRKKSKSQTPEQKLDKMIVADNSQSECRVLASYHLPPSGRPITPFTMAGNPETYPCQRSTLSASHLLHQGRPINLHSCPYCWKISRFHKYNFSAKLTWLSIWWIFDLIKMGKRKWESYMDVRWGRWW